MKKNYLPHTILIIAILSSCGETDPSKAKETDSTTETTGTTGTVNTIGTDGTTETVNTSNTNDTSSVSEPIADPSNYYPLAVGYFWEYEETEGPQTTTLRYEITEKKTMTFENGIGEKEVYLFLNTFIPATLEKRIQYIEDDGTRPARVQHLVWDEFGELTKQRNFNPSFLRFDRSQINKGDKWSEKINRTTDSFTASLPPVQDSVTYNYEVMDTAAEVTVPAGTFTCIYIKRIAVESEEVKYYWFAAGVGKVQEITENVKTEMLSDYNTGL